MLPTKKSRGRTLAEIDAELKALQTERESVRAAEVQGVIGRIKEAIEHYGLTAADLGLAGRGGALRNAARGAAVSPARATKPRLKANTTNPPKYADGAGRSWTGRGKRPGWFVEALAAGKSPEDLLIKPVG